MSRPGSKQSILSRFKAALPFSNRFSAFLEFPRFHTVWMTADPESFAEMGYGSNAHVFAAIRSITTKCTAIPWRVYNVVNKKAFARFKEFDRVDKGSRIAARFKDEALEANDVHPLNDLFVKPNYLQTWAEFIENVIGFKEIMGNAFIWGGRVDGGDNKGRIKMIFPMSPSVVKIQAGPYPQEIDGYTFHEKPIPKEDVLHLRYFNPRLNGRRIGLSPLEVLIKQITQTNSFAEANATLAQSMFRIPGLLQIKGKKLDKKARQEIREQFVQEQRGENLGLPIVTDADFTWQDIAFNPKDVDWVNGFKLSAMQIAMAFEVPPELLGDSEHKTYNTVPEAIRYFYFSKIIPEMGSLRDGLNQWLVPEWEEQPGTLWIDFDINGIEILQEERTAVMDRAIKGWQSGLYTLNEGLKKIGEPEIGPDGQVRLLPMGAQMYSEAEWSAAAEAEPQEPQPVPAALAPFVPQPGKPAPKPGEQQPSEAQLAEAIAYLEKMRQSK